MENFEEYLMEKYPKLHPKNAEGIVLPPRCGNYCPSGWQIIIDDLCQCTHDYISSPMSRYKGENNQYEFIYPPVVTIEQIKSKLGGLRFYFIGGDDYVSGMVRFAKYLCSKTCEITGESGSLIVIDGHWMTLSENEIKKRLDNQ